MHARLPRQALEKLINDSELLMEVSYNSHMQRLQIVAHKPPPR